MVRKSGKTVVVHPKKQRPIHMQKTVLPVLETPVDIFDDINRMYYNDPWMTPWWNRWVIDQSPVTRGDRIRILPVDLMDTGDGYQIITEMPGVHKKDIEILITSGTISICGATETKIRSKNEGYIKKERGYSTLCRYLKFPEDVDPNNAEAFLHDGVLQININKKTPSGKGTLVPIK